MQALASFLHSFYNGVENSLKRIARAFDESAPHGENWHAALLNTMAETTPKRPNAVTPSTRDSLRAYLGFRHVFRHSYSFDLRWSKMAALVLDVENVLQAFVKDLESFLQRIESTPSDR